MIKRLDTAAFSFSPPSPYGLLSLRQGGDVGKQGRGDLAYDDVNHRQSFNIESLPFFRKEPVGKVEQSSCSFFQSFTGIRHSFESLKTSI